MNYCERIPVKTKAMTLAGNNIRIDCEGLEVTIFANGGDLYLKAHESVSDDNAYIIKDGQSFTACGSFVINGAGANARLLYCKVI